MQCPKCKAAIEPQKIKGDAAIDTACELRLKCECGARFYAFVDHDDWTDAEGDEAVNLADGNGGAT